MTPGDSAFLASLPGWAFAFVLVLSRISAAVMLLPAFGEVELPSVIRAGLAIVFTLVLLPVVAPHLPPMRPKTSSCHCRKTNRRIRQSRLSKPSRWPTGISTCR